MYKAVIFDLDGTLLNTIDDLADAMNTVLARNGMPPRTVEVYKYLVGDGIVNLVQRAAPEGTDADTLASLLAQQRQQYAANCAVKTCPYDGIVELLAELRKRGLRLAVLSNKPQAMTPKVIEHFLPDAGFEIVRGEGDETPKKPDPAGARQIAKEMGIAPAQILFVGDTNIDMQTARAAGMYSVGALWGFRTAEELLGSGARVLIAHPMDLLKLL